jgi:hypothetical protein
MLNAIANEVLTKSLISGLGNQLITENNIKLKAIPITTFLSLVITSSFLLDVKRRGAL